MSTTAPLKITRDAAPVVVHPQNNQIVQALTKAEPIYPVFDTDLVDRLACGLPLPGDR
jgi:hypothetical protein